MEKIDMKKRQSRKGFTLVETMVALAILAIVSVVFVSMFTTMARISMKTTDNKTVDATLAAEIAKGETTDRSELDSGAFYIGTYAIPYDAYQYRESESGRAFVVLEEKSTG
jgi:prepilin-type N-terminal cleavage/methylation domain-containing protein